MIKLSVSKPTVRLQGVENPVIKITSTTSELRLASSGPRGPQGEVGAEGKPGRDGQATIPDTIHGGFF